MGGILILIGGPHHVPDTKERAEKLFVPALLIMFSGPFISGVLMNFLLDCKEGFRKLLSRSLRWRTDGRWYAIALFTGPILVATVHLERLLKVDSLQLDKTKKRTRLFNTLTGGKT